jgi:polyisoprenoid-binding protein YceI
MEEAPHERQISPSRIPRYLWSDKGDPTGSRDGIKTAIGNSMKKAILSALLLALTITQAAVASETYEINPENSSVLFKVRLLWTTNIEGCFCGGVSGRVSLDADAPQKSIVKLEIKTDTLNTGLTQLNNQIKGAAFLDVEKFPLITFKNTSAQRVNAQQYNLTGDLFILSSSGASSASRATHQR